MYKKQEKKIVTVAVNLKKSTFMFMLIRSNQNINITYSKNRDLKFQNFVWVFMGGFKVGGNSPLIRLRTSHL